MIFIVSVLEWLIYSKIYIREVKIVIFVVMIGVGVCIVIDVSVNFKGFLVVFIVVIFILF